MDQGLSALSGGPRAALAGSCHGRLTPPAGGNASSATSFDLASRRAAEPPRWECAMAFGECPDDAALRGAWQTFCRQLEAAGECAFKDAIPPSGLHRVDAL